MKLNVWILLLISTCFFLSAAAKICWEECSSSSQDIKSVDVVGCRRRRTPPGQSSLRFKCAGLVGPPCTVKRGDRVTLKVKFGVPATQVSTSIQNMTQNAFWVTSFGLELPWAGMDTSACKYLSPLCEEADQQARTDLAFTYPIDISKLYPTGYYNLKWLLANHPEGGKLNMGCFRFAIRIV